jgi:diguanylate cyclase (GGDEF)-like protein
LILIGEYTALKDIPSHIDPQCKRQLSIEISQINIQRGKLISPIIIGIELILLIISFFSRFVDTSFKFDWYAFMYLLMIIITALFWLFLMRLEHNIVKQGSLNPQTINLTITSYCIFFITWGALISLLDQALYGNIVVFLVNILLVSFIFYLKNIQILIPQLIGACVLMIGLPYFQPSRDIIIGHYVNICILLVFSWFIARTNYANYVKNFLNQILIDEKSILLAQINDDLLFEIQSRKQAQQKLEAANEQLKIVSSLDYLTGIPNRRRLDEFLKQQWSKAIKEQLPISIMMIDIDFFKLFNDTNGHIAGDRCLQAVAGVLNRSIREGKDFVARYGGEEFTFVATGMNRKETLLLGETIRTKVEALQLEHRIPSMSPYITISVGINWLIPTSKDLLPDAIGRADQALYQAKRGGRNRIMLAK